MYKIISMEKEKVVDKNINLGIQLLRMFLCFWVLLFHFCDKNKINYNLFFLIHNHLFHVPCFSFLSFYYSYNIFFSYNMKYMQKRLVRLLIPFILWPFIDLIFNNIIHYEKIITFHDLKLQLLVGRQFYIPLWYLFSMLFLTILFYIISKLFINQFLLIIQFLAICSYLAQYSYLCHYFIGYKNNVKLPILDTISVLPLSVIGLNFANSNCLSFFGENQKKSLFFSFLFIFFLFKYNIFNDLKGYNGIIHIYSSLFLFLGFYLLPFENLNNHLKRILLLLSNYTNGIYCSHLKIIQILRATFGIHRNLKNGIIIYFLSYFISYIGIKIFGKSKLKYLFI